MDLQSLDRPTTKMDAKAELLSVWSRRDQRARTGKSDHFQVKTVSGGTFDNLVSKQFLGIFYAPNLFYVVKGRTGPYNP